MRSLLLTIFLSTAFAFDFQEITRQELEKLRTDPASYYSSPPVKMNTYDSRPVPYRQLQQRTDFFKLWQGPFKTEIRSVDNVRNLIYNFHTYEQNFKLMAQRGLNQGTVKVPPWSGHYFPFYRGIAANRYNDGGYNRVNNNWLNSYNYYRSNPAHLIYESEDLERINRLSPAEKYDLIMGTGFALTEKMWAIGREFQEEYGKVETWMGICHGWAPASFVFPRPVNTITIPSYHKRLPIKFYPPDIKALASLLWARNEVLVNFIGGRCNEPGKPRVDGLGRPINPDCQDTNPGTLHMALINQIGLLGRPFIMDSSYDREVWNAPITSYRFSFFNPISKKPVDTPLSGIVPVNTRGDRYRQFRAPNARYIIGVSAEITYQQETVAILRTPDSPAYDKHNKVIYLYDLELDQSYNIVGGEWHKNQHPDFLWTPKVNTNSYTAGDRELVNLPRWNGRDRVDQEYRDQALNMARNKGVPLSLIVERLMEMSK